MRKPKRRSPSTKARGRPERVSPEDVIAALRKSRGIARYAATSLGCHRHTIANMAKKYPEIQAVLQDEVEGLIDTAEGKLAEAIARGELSAIMFFLKCRAKGRGYTERSELTGANGRPLVEPVDLSKLSDGELEELSRIMTKAAGKTE